MGEWFKINAYCFGDAGGPKKTAHPFVHAMDAAHFISELTYV